jgi:hypothetical protein
MKRFYLFLFVSCLAAIEVNAQFSIGGEVRPRTEYRHGFKTLASENAKAAFFTEQRSRLYFNYKSDKVAAKITFQDVRLWGGATQIYKSDAALTNLYEAWGEYKFTEALSIRVGRQALDYDNARILGDLGWAAQGRSHDLALFQWQKNQSKWHIGAAFNQEDVLSPSEPGRLKNTYYFLGGNYKTMQFSWFNQSFESGNVSFLVLNNGVQSALDSTVYFSQTTGAYAVKKLGKATLNGEAYYQFGKNPTGKSIGAFLLAANITYPVGKTPVTLGADYLSGASSNSSKDNAFNPLYGTHHKFYGYMDYFYVGNGHGSVGIKDLYIKAKFKVSEKGALETGAHQFFSGSAIPSADNTTYKTSLGTELDLVFSQAFSKDVLLHVGYSQMIASSSMEIIKPGGSSDAFNNWGWIMLTIKPTFFESTP